MVWTDIGDSYVQGGGVTTLCRSKIVLGVSLAEVCATCLRCHLW